MLNHIYLKNFAIVEKLDLDLNSGMTALTGETGAGKSILIDAIGLVLGDRADSGVVRHGTDKAEITLSVDLEDTPSAKEWLIQQDLDDDEQCILRRVISSSGKSRAWINGTPCNLGMLRQLGEQLVDIHGQHEHQSLMKKEMQRKMLDDFADNQHLLDKTKQCYVLWKSLADRLETLRNQNSEHQAKLDLLRFQTQELDEFNLEKNEALHLDEEHARLSNAGQLIDTTNNGLAQLYDSDEQSIYSAISDVIINIEETRKIDKQLQEPLEMLSNAQILIQEATDSLRRYQESIELDPERLNWVNSRLSSLHELSRKHQTSAEGLFNKWQELHKQLSELGSDEYDIEQLEINLLASEEKYKNITRQLSKTREKAAKKLSSGVTTEMQGLGMDGGVFAISLEASDHFSAHGIDIIEFKVSANPGQPLMPLVKVASGGELSRISLAIQMIATQRVSLPTLIFDEVDSGIGGGVAETVGQQLRRLGENRQVLCVTHLSQVASQAHNHYKVTKVKNESTTSTGMLILDEKQRVDEIARMMGGIEITHSTLNLAKEMLEAA